MRILFFKTYQIIPSLPPSSRFQHEEEEVVGKLEKELGAWDPLEEVNILKKMTGKKKIGQVRAVLGIEPVYPVVIVPGMASTSLQVLFL